MKTPLERRDKSKYCCFHRDYDHDTKECRNLKDQIKELIYWGHLGRFLHKPQDFSPHPQGPVKRQINIIIDGLA